MEQEGTEKQLRRGCPPLSGWIHTHAHVVSTNWTGGAINNNFVFKKDMKSGRRWVAGSQREVVRGGARSEYIAYMYEIFKDK